LVQLPTRKERGKVCPSTKWGQDTEGEYLFAMEKKAFFKNKRTGTKKGEKRKARKRGGTSGPSNPPKKTSSSKTMRAAIRKEQKSGGPQHSHRKVKGGVKKGKSRR